MSFELDSFWDFPQSILLFYLLSEYLFQPEHSGLRTTWQARDYSIAMRKYSGVKTMQIVGEIRYADAKSKGVKNSSMSDGDILRELVFKNFVDLGKT